MLLLLLAILIFFVAFRAVSYGVLIAIGILFGIGWLISLVGGSDE